MTDLTSTRALAPVLLMVLSGTAALAGTPEAFLERGIARGINYPISLGAFQFGSGLGLFDIDGDGDPDALIIGAVDGRVGLYENDGTGFFTDRTNGDFGVARMAKHTNYAGVSAADYDGDGDLDIYLSRYGAPNIIYRNDGDWTFTDVTAASGLGDPGHSLSTAWADCNADGLLDVYVCNRTFTNGDPTENGFYENRGDGTFTEKAAAVGIQRAGDPTLVAAFFDYDFDTDPDLYLATDKGSGPAFTNHFFENLGNAFVNVTGPTNTAANLDSMGIAIGDIDRNGFYDLFLTNLPIGHKLLMGNPDGTFTDRTAESGTATLRFGWGTVMFDADNDGLEDIYICHANDRNSFYHNTGAFPMQDIALGLNIATTGTSYCVATADIDGDGDLDMLVGKQSDRAQLYINNNEANGNNWAMFDVVGQGANTFAVGATVQVQMTGTTPAQRREVRAGHHYKAQDPTTVHFGVGANTILAKTTIDWPNGGGRRILYNYPANTRWAAYPAERLGDLDGDGVVTLADREAILDRHIAANGRAPEPVAPGIEMLDADGDADFDEADVLAIGAPCPSDVAPPVGVLDLADVNTFIADFVSQDPSADLNGDGVFDLGDLGTFVTGFTGGCG
jgi:hypothetical protein